MRAYKRYINDAIKMLQRLSYTIQYVFYKRNLKRHESSSVTLHPKQSAIYSFSGITCAKKKPRILSSEKNFNIVLL